MGDTVRCKVVGPAEVLGVAAPGQVELDPELYNIDALVSAGHVEIWKAAPEPTGEPGIGTAARPGPRPAAGAAGS